jgi:hypothetical protein
VIAFPKDNAIVWKILTPSAIEALRMITADGGVRIFVGWVDLPAIDMNMQVMLKLAEAEGRTVLSGDVSNFDANLPPKLIEKIGEVIGSWTRGYEHLFANLVRGELYNTSLITPNKFWDAQPSSLKSGSGGTNFVGSLCNLAIQYYGEEIGMYKVRNVCVLGDDFVLDGEGVSPEATSEVFAHFGMESNPSKQFVERGFLHFLQRLHQLGRPGGIASVMRTLGHAMSLERLQFPSSQWNKYSYTVRTLSQLQNAVFNPWFTSLVDTVKSGDRVKLGADFNDPNELVKQSGIAGEYMLEQAGNVTWKDLGKMTAFPNWAVNGVVRGESLPSDVNALYQRVYGREFHEAA